jgi:isoprenylcysteine carboxyl methyltransferase (ICMT) family protein YpbQ
MSHRTRDLPELSGLPRIVRELRYHEASRQALAFVLIAWFAAVGVATWSSLALGTVIALLGTAVRVYASGYILKNQALATDGPYAFVRHPLYTGNILIIIGFSVASAQWWTAVVTLVFFWFYYPTAIEYEDRKLRRLFGERWEAWAAQVPALVPRRIGLPSVGNGGWSLKKSYQQNGEPLIVAYIVFWLAYLAWPLR